MTKPTAQTGLTCCAVKTAHRLDFTRVEVEEILRLSARMAAASTAQPHMHPAAVTPRRTSPRPGQADRSAGDLAERHALRGYDAIHLAALLQAGGPAYGAFACWDGDLLARPQARYKLVPR